jgi:hypothetical protein
VFVGFRVATQPMIFLWGVTRSLGAFCGDGLVRGYLPTLQFCMKLLGRDGVQKRAIEEVAQLPKEYPYRQDTLELLGNLKITLEARTNIQPEDRDLIMQLSPLYLEQIQAAKQEGKQEDRQEIALKMLRKKMPIETIAELTELNFEQLQSLQSQLETN